MLKTIVWTSVFLLCFTFIETAILSNIVVLPAVPDLVLLVVLYVSVKNGSLVGEISGFISGLLLDFLSAAPLGLNSFLRTLIAYVTGLFSGSFNLDAIFMPALTGCLGTGGKAFGTWILSFFFSSSIVTYSLTSVVFWFEVAANTLLAPVVFALLGLFSPLLVMDRRITHADNRS